MFIERPSRIGAMLAVTLAFACSDAMAAQSTARGRYHATAETRHPQQVGSRHNHLLVRHERSGPRHTHGVVGYPAGLRSMPSYAAPAYAGPGYIFVPGRGILGEDCNMPTSTCPNELRDVQ